jgi:hypothetical protein
MAFKSEPFDETAKAFYQRWFKKDWLPILN